MSATNSIHGIVLAGALLIGVTAHNVVGYILAFVAAVFAAANVVGGYVVTERMLKMFRRRTPDAVPAADGAPAVLNGHRGLRALLSKAGKSQSGGPA
jgi:NAD(P) transhydrogenase subunit alpha